MNDPTNAIQGNKEDVVKNGTAEEKSSAATNTNS